MRMGLLSKNVSHVEKKSWNVEEISAGKQWNLLILARKGPTFLHCLFQLLKAEIIFKQHKVVTFEILAN